MQNGLSKIYPSRKDFSLLHSYGATANGIPDNYSNYDGRIIPNQDQLDGRFNPPTRPIPYGCTGETQTFDAGIQDNSLYYPADFYFATPPGTDGQGRDIRDSLKTAITRGYQGLDGKIGNKRLAYFNCYGSGAIDDFDAVRIGLWINQIEKRNVSIGSWWYWGIYKQGDGILPIPSFNTSEASLHNYLCTGWKTINGVEYLECIPWCGMESGNNGVVYISRVIFNALMGQPYTGSYTITKVQSVTPIPIGMTAIVDHLVSMIRQLFGL